MKTDEDSQRSLDDVIFENRNHEYGAYVIRRTYPDNVNKGALMAVGVVAILTIISIVPKEIVPVIMRPTIPGPTTTQPPTIIPIIPPSHATQPVRGNSALPPRPVVEEVVDNTILPNEEVIPGEKLGVETGDLNAVDVSTVIPEEIGPSFPVEEKIWTQSEVMPEYVGGLRAMVHFISQNIKYPTKARRMGHEGTVFVSFIIGKDGSVIDPKIVKGFDIDCENEAIKVMAKMSRWKPGLQSGVPVLVRMVIPIKFTLAQ
ncbi:MAG: energy transducer TonB [Chryseolinea sp.]